MLVASVISCGFLLLGSGSCIHILRRHSFERYSRLLPQFVWATIGIMATGIRSFNILTYALFEKTYPIDPQSLYLGNTDDPRTGRSALDISCATTSIGALVCSLYLHHGHHLLGSCIVFLLVFLEIFRNLRSRGTHNPMVPNWSSSARMMIGTANAHRNALCTLFGGILGLVERNHWSLLGHLSYAVTTLWFPSQSYSDGMTMRRVLENYMMLTYIILMTEALRSSTS